MPTEIDEREQILEEINDNGIGLISIKDLATEFEKIRVGVKRYASLMNVSSQLDEIDRKALLRQNLEGQLEQPEQEQSEEIKIPKEKESKEETSLLSKLSTGLFNFVKDMKTEIAFTGIFAAGSLLMPAEAKANAVVPKSDEFTESPLGAGQDVTISTERTELPRDHNSSSWSNSTLRDIQQTINYQRFNIQNYRTDQYEAGSVGQSSFSPVNDAGISSKGSNQSWRNDKPFIQSVNNLAEEYDVNANDLLAVMHVESGINPARRNMAGSSATGLIQFVESTARKLGTTTEALSRMSRVEQMKYVRAYFKSVRLPKNADLATIYAAVFYPAAMYRDMNSPIITRGDRAYAQNASLDVGNKGFINKRDLYIRASKGLSGIGASRSSFPKEARTKSKDIMADVNAFESSYEQTKANNIFILGYNQGQQETKTDTKSAMIFSKTDYLNQKTGKRLNG